MRALVFDLSIPRYLAAKAAGKRFPALFDGAPSCLSLRDDEPAPALPGEDWVRLRPILTGLCGSDLAVVYFKMSAALSAYGPKRFVMGHELLARVIGVGRGVRGVREGDRVVVDPWLRCALRGVPDCARCAVDEYATCERAGTGPRKGVMLGACAELPGGFCDELVAHESQCFTLPDSVSDARGVIGGGPIAFTLVFALEELAPDTDVTLVTVERGQAEVATTLGAERAWVLADEPLLPRAARHTRATVLQPELGPGFLAGGFDRVFDCVGSRDSLADAFSLVRAGGTIVMVGAAGVLRDLELSHLWTKEVSLVGTYSYGFETWRESRARTFAITRELLTGTRLPLERLVTHRLTLDQYRDALRMNLHRGQSGAIKTVLAP
jgi:threonine dehydrogenase-like Zn-dependent dehydrogenase